MVILIDEYDKPLLQAIGNEELQDEYRSILKTFYGNLKSQDGNIKFALLTGVTKNSTPISWASPTARWSKASFRICSPSYYYYYTPESGKEAKAIIGHFIRDLRTGYAEQFMTRLQTFFEDADYRVAGKMEIYFQNAMYIIFRLLGFYAQVERATARGRVDVTLQTPDYIYVMGLKLDASAREAMQQIEDKAYAARCAKSASVSPPPPEA